MDFNSMMFLLMKQDLRARRRRIRNASPQERRLWKEVLRDYPVPFLRKCAMINRRNLPASFYCHDLRLAVDVQREPGGNEARRIGAANRERNLRGVGTASLFISEREIDEDMDAVRRRIDEAVRARSEWLEERRKEREKAASGGEKG